MTTEQTAHLNELMECVDKVMDASCPVSERIDCLTGMIEEFDLAADSLAEDCHALGAVVMAVAAERARWHLRSLKTWTKDSE